MSESSNSDRALRAFGAALPNEAIVADRATIEKDYSRNVTALRREIAIVLKPANEAEVARIIEAANAERIPLYPFSTGKNWGLGSKLPVEDGCALVDLSRMDRVVEVNEEFGYAIIEPGVTQARLAEVLKQSHPGLTLNFTGSYAHTSIVGNVLDRGDGARARVDDLLGVRGILGNGTPFQTGGVWRFVGSDTPSHCSRYTAGPDLVGLFAQSAFGIVTQMAFRLIHKPERRYLVFGAAAEESLEALMDTLDHFGRQGLVNRGSINIGYENRFLQAKTTMQSIAAKSGSPVSDAPGAPAAAEAKGAWNFYVLLTGTHRTVTALDREVREALGRCCVAVDSICVDEVTDPYKVLPPFLHPLVKPLFGMPDTESIKLIYQLTSTPIPADPLAIDVDHTPFGMKCYIPVVPPRGRYVRRAASIISAVANRHAVNVKPSFFGDGRTLITIHFRTDDPDQVRRAESCELELWQEMNAAGFPPYRLSIEQMQRLPAIDPKMLELTAMLKTVLDPNRIISPGRYSLVHQVK